MGKSFFLLLILVVSMVTNLGFAKDAFAFSKIQSSEKGLLAIFVDQDIRYNNINHIGSVVNSNGQIFDVQKVVDIMANYYGYSYAWGGKLPSTGFDSSGLVSYAFSQVGIDMRGNAEAQFAKTIAINKKDAMPGDLVFWSTYKRTASHVGMYVGNDTFINSNTKGVVNSSVISWNNIYTFLGFRRIVKK